MSHSRSPRVLVVDDDPQVRQLYVEFLEADYDVRAADSGSAAIDAVADGIDVILLDRRMPGLSGDDVLNRIRADDRETAIALVTAVEPDFDVLELGFDDYVVKPVDGHELRDLVETLLLRQEYDEVIREYFSLVSKVVGLHRSKARDELRENPAYLETEEYLEDIKDHARAALDAAIEAGKFDELFRDLIPDDDSSDAPTEPDTEVVPVE